jgi:g-D-glutamyl-meso-diaminopimelate peptidase
MEEQIKQLVKTYSYLTLSEVGKSVQNRSLYCITLGHGKRKVHINGSHHANEWITSIIIVKSIEILCELIKNKETCAHINLFDLLENTTYDFVPMVNPDGVELCVNGTKEKHELDYFKVLNEGLIDFSRWKANARGVDLNRNYNAGFNDYKCISEKCEPSFAYYEGSTPESEPESRALVRLTKRRRYDMVLAYHTQGEVIYWTYKDFIIDKAEKYAKMFSEASGYALDLPEVTAASGGYKDWFIRYFKKPGFTIECGLGENPIDVSQIDSIIIRTFPIILLASKDLRKEE